MLQVDKRREEVAGRSLPIRGGGEIDIGVKIYSV
jgi:hypothetical protein